MANKNDYSIELNGVSSQIVVTGYSVPVNAFSISFWYKPMVVDANDRIIDQQDAGPANGFSFNHPTANDANLQFIIRNVGTSVAVITTTDMVMNQWNHICGTYEVDEVRLYVNGKIQGTTDFVATMTASTAVLTIGRRAPTATNFATGRICGLQVYNFPLYGSNIRKIFKNKFPFQSGCVVNLRMDEGSGSTANDSSGSGKIGVLTSCTYSIDVPYTTIRNIPEGPRVNLNVKPVNSLFFDGVNDYIDLNTATILPDLTRYVTISAWCYRGGDGIRLIIGNQRDSTTSGWQFKIANTAKDHLEFTFRDQNTNSKGFIGDAVTPIDRWFHAVVTYDGQTCRFYIDGVEEEKETLSTTFTISLNSSDNVRIGHRVAGGGAEFFNGNIAKVKVWGRVLNNDEIQNLYLLDTYSPYKLLGDWKLNEGSGTVAIDSSSFANNGTINGPVYSNI